MLRMAWSTLSDSTRRPRLGDLGLAADARGVDEDVRLAVRARRGRRWRRASCPGGRRRACAPRRGRGSTGSTCRRSGARRGRCAAMRSSSSGSASASCGGSAATMAASSSPMPRPWSALTGIDLRRRRGDRARTRRRRRAGSRPCWRRRRRACRPRGAASRRRGRRVRELGRRVGHEDDHVGLGDGGLHVVRRSRPSSGRRSRGRSRPCRRACSGGRTRWCRRSGGRA